MTDVTTRQKDSQKYCTDLPGVSTSASQNQTLCLLPRRALTVRSKLK